MSAQDLEQRAPAIIDNAGNVSRDSEIADPHHEGACRWKWSGGKLYHNTHGAKRWVEVKKIHPTPARIKALASILNYQPVPVVDDAMVERALNAKAGNWPVWQLFSCEDEAREIMCIALTAALARAQGVQS